MAERRIYKISESITFAKTNSHYGKYSNMAPNLGLQINGVSIYTSEALYQACKFPLFPDIQHKILSESNPVIAKRIARKYDRYVRQDWDTIRFKVMKWCIEIKLMQNWKTMSALFMESRNLPIVEYSEKDELWGAMPDGNGNLIGVNALGRILMQIREEINLDTPPISMMPPPIIGFLLYGEEIGITYASEYDSFDEIMI